jgi:Tfp pilus assembly protein PilO
VPQQRRVSLIQAQVAQEQATQEMQQAVAALLDDLEAQRRQLPQEPDPSWLVREVVAVAQQSGVQLTTITQEPVQPFDQYTRLGVTLQLNASYHQLGAFLDELERSPAFIRVERIGLTRGVEDDKPAVIQVRLSTVYVPPLLARAGGG